MKMHYGITEWDSWCGLSLDIKHITMNRQQVTCKRCIKIANIKNH